MARFAPQRPRLTLRVPSIFTLIGVLIGLLLGLRVRCSVRDTVHATGSQRQAVIWQGGQLAVRAEGNTPLANTIHTLCPSNGSPYQNFQLRIVYATYKLMAGMSGGEKHVAFTRILHRTLPDELMAEVPTFRADPLQPKCDVRCEYPVADRANAVRQFLEAARADPTLIQAPWLYMIESDYVFMKPLQLPVVTNPPVDGWGFHFRYIKPTQHREAMRKLYPEAAGPPKDIPCTGPAPVLLRREDWEKVVPQWERLTAVIEADSKLREELGWVREMYAFSAAVALLKLRLDIQQAPASPLIAQLPVGKTLGNAHAFHYTQPTTYLSKATGAEVWKFDKRAFTRAEDVNHLQPLPMPPPYENMAYKFKDGWPLTRGLHEALEQMLAQMNRGIATLQPLDVGS